MLDLSRRIATGGHLELARRTRRRLGDKLTLIEPADPDDVHGFAFYDVFLDRRRWPDLIRRGHAATVDALDPFRSRSKTAKRPTSAGSGS
jgi:hypothetical protein